MARPSAPPSAGGSEFRADLPRDAFRADLLRGSLGAFDRQSDKRTDGIAAYCAYYGLDHLVARPDLQHRMGTLQAGDERLAVQSFEPDGARATVVVCHGYYDHVGLYGHLIEYLLDQELAVVCFDQPGHGLSTGKRANIGCFDDYVASLGVVLGLLETLPGPYHLVGQSMGGAIVMEHLRQSGGAAYGEIVLLAPLIRPAWWSVNQILWRLAKATIEQRPRTITANADNPEFIEFLKHDPLQPMVLPVQWITAMAVWMQAFERAPPMKGIAPKVIQGHADRTVAWRHNLKVLDRLFEPEVLHLPEARHHLVNESPGLRARMWQWLSERCRWHG